jgi:5-methyltetrahydrofolate--homocysteine methyltransferase
MSGLVTEDATLRSAARGGALAERVVIADGAMGTMLQAYDLTPEDFEGHEGFSVKYRGARYFSV